MFDDILPAYHTQQHTLQLQSIAHHHSVPISYPSNNNHALSSSTHATPAATPSTASVNLPFVGTTPSSGSAAQPINSKKRGDPPLTPAASVDGSETYFSSQVSEQPAQQNEASSSSSTVRQTPTASEDNKTQEPPKKKRRVALTRVGDLE